MLDAMLRVILQSPRNDDVRCHSCICHMSVGFPNHLNMSFWSSTHLILAPFTSLSGWFSLCCWHPFVLAYEILKCLPSGVYLRQQIRFPSFLNALWCCLGIRMCLRACIHWLSIMHLSSQISNYTWVFELSLMIETYCTLCTGLCSLRWWVALVYVNEMRWILLDTGYCWLGIWLSLQKFD